MEKDLIDFFEHLSCPKVNGIIFPNGDIELIDLKIDWNQKKHIIEKKGKITVDFLEKNNNLFWSDCAILNSIEDKGVLVVSGESDYGSDGFVAVLNLSTKELKWIAFFDSSNPFDNLRLVGNSLYAISTSNYVWEFNLDNPTDISISWKEEG